MKREEKIAEREGKEWKGDKESEGNKNFPYLGYFRLKFSIFWLISELDSKRIALPIYTLIL